VRIPQSSDGRGSLKWIRRLAAHDPEKGLEAIEPCDSLPDAKFRWLSPIGTDDFAEYRDGAFLDRIGHLELAPALAKFWPSRGPQWDGLGRFDDGTVVLVEAKANIPELKSRCAATARRTRLKIEPAFAGTARALGSLVTSAWTNDFYQFANRLAHLHFLRANRIQARQLFIYFVGDADVGAPFSSRVVNSSIQCLAFGSLLRQRLPT
jgi:hypothetical protein